MQIIRLSPTRFVGFCIVAVVSGAIALVCVSQIQPWWRHTAVAMLLLGGWWSWRRYRLWRPAELRIHADRHIECVLSSGHVITVQRVQPGILQPWLVSARLVGEDGESLDLFVSAACIDERSHWHVRRALIGWRPAHHDTDSAAPEPAGDSVR